MHPLIAVAAVAFAAGGPSASAPSFPGTFVRHPPVAARAADRDCLSLGDDMFDRDVGEIGACKPLGLHAVGRVGGTPWIYGVYERRWLLAPTDTVVEKEVVLFTRSGSNDPKPVWHYRYESAILASVTPELAPTAGSGVIFSVDECVNGTGGCSQSFAILRRGAPTVVKLAFLDSLNRRFPDGIQHGFHVDVRTLRGSLGLYSKNDANCCPSTIGEFSLRLRGDSLELATLRTRRAE